jgi:hypothetical protein
LINLNFPKYNFTFKEESNGIYILDEIRKKYVKYTPEEQVRQNFIKFLIEDKKYPKALFSVEHKIDINKNILRCDILIFNKNFTPKIVVECKSPKVKITEKTFNQAVEYYYGLQPQFIILTNGITHFYIKKDEISNSFKFISEIPNYVNE